MMKSSFRFHGLFQCIGIIALCFSTQVWADDTPRHRLVDGVDIYIGVLPAEVMSKSTADMHDAIPYEHSFHLVVALFDEKSGNRITDADIVASLSGQAEIETKTLDRMPIVNAPSYGNIFMLPGLGKFTIELKVSLTGSDEIISTDFALSFLEANADGNLKVPAMIRDSLHERATYDYGIWTMMAVNTAVFIIFAFSFTRPKTGRDWRSFGAFSAFIVALFTEMYGFPLTIYLLSGWFASHYPDLNLYSHGAGHLWSSLMGFEGDPHADPLHILSNLFIFGGFFMLAAAWRVLHKAQKNHLLASTGLYASVRHPQYDAFIIIMTGFLLQWPTILTLLMFPVLVWMYIRLARYEEGVAMQEFGEEYKQYMARIPAFIPNWAKQGG